MILDKDVAVPMRDGAILRANVFRPQAEGRFPVLATFGPYGKDVHLSQFMPPAWERIQQHHPEILAASSCKHLVFETPDPEVWVPHGYVIVKVDSRGAGKSPGKLDINSPAEFRDFYDAIEWAGEQRWSSGKVGLLGISYYAAGQWSVAAMRPRYLSALLPWQGTFDFFRDRTRQDGIFASGFVRRWWANSVLRNQYGNPETPFIDIVTGERNTGPESLTRDQLAAHREDYIANVLAHPTLDEWYRQRIPDLSQIDLPTLVVANWGGLGLHLRGTIAGFLGILSREKWLKVQAGSYFITFLAPENVAMQRRFFDHYLKGIDNEWDNEPRVTVAVRTPDDTVHRTIASTDLAIDEARCCVGRPTADSHPRFVLPSVIDAFQITIEKSPLHGDILRREERDEVRTGLNFQPFLAGRNSRNPAIVPRRCRPSPPQLATTSAGRSIWARSGMRWRYQSSRVGWARTFAM